MQRNSSRGNMSRISAAQPSPTHRNVNLPQIPSNLPGDQNQEAEFNSIGYYGDLLRRLDNQIKTCEDVYKNSFFKVKQ